MLSYWRIGISTSCKNFWTLSSSSINMAWFPHLYCMIFILCSGKLASSSGFQSMQFRLLENKLGVKKASILFKLSYQKGTALRCGDMVIREYWKLGICISSCLYNRLQVVLPETFSRRCMIMAFIFWHWKICFSFNLITNLHERYDNSSLLYLAYSANLGLLCMPHPDMGPLV